MSFARPVSVSRKLLRREPLHALPTDPPALRRRRRRSRLRWSSRPPRVEGVDDRSRSRGRVDDRAQVAGLLVARAHPDQEAVRDQQADLAAGQRGQAAQHVVELGEGDLGEAQLLGQDPAGLPLDLLRGGPSFSSMTLAGLKPPAASTAACGPD